MWLSAECNEDLLGRSSMRACRSWSRALTAVHVEGVALVDGGVLVDADLAVVIARDHNLQDDRIACSTMADTRVSLDKSNRKKGVYFLAVVVRNTGGAADGGGVNLGTVTAVGEDALRTVAAAAVVSVVVVGATGPE